MKIITLNVNGIRSALKKGLFGWLAKQNAEVICLQEVRADLSHLSQPAYQLEGYHCYYAPAEKPGYSGVALFSREKPLKIVKSLGFALSDTEGRYIHAQWGDITVASLYMPSGTSGDARQALKYEYMDAFEKILNHYREEKHHYIICGDWNIAHKKIDLKNWQGNQKNSGFLPEERAWLDKLFDEYGWVDAFRCVNQESDQYTWWSARGQAWAKNVGWRIDYQIVSPELKETVRSASIYKDERFSDHAPVIMEYELG